MKIDGEGNPHTNPSQAAIASQIANESIEYLESLEREDFPISEEEISNDKNFETNLFQYQEKLLENNYLILEENSQLYIDRIVDYET